MGPFNLEILPGNGSCIGKRLQRLVSGLLRCHSRRNVESRTEPSNDVLPFVFGEEPGEHPFPMPLQHPLDPRDIDEVDPHSDQLHRSHTHSTGPSSGPGTGR